MSRTPLSTYRIQFNASFRFADATRIVPYLASLGITDLYASPILKARPGSTHGYDIVDAVTINPELGGEEELDRLSAELRKHGMGLLLDIVPNHMAASSENAWWMSLLENGPHSRYINYFDIDWEAFSQKEDEKKVLLPVLGRPHGEALESGELRLGFDERGFFIQYFDRRFPVAPHSYNRILQLCLDEISHSAGVDDATERELRELTAGGRPAPDTPSNERLHNSKFLKETLWRLHEADTGFRRALGAVIERINGSPGAQASFEQIDQILEEQWYRLAYWRLASEGINYRRFFDIADLVGLRIEEPEVFEARHAGAFRLIEEGKVTGLRIDHIDGLYDPVSHLRKLQSRIGSNPAGSFHVVVEKILARGESLPEEFMASGTTGFDYLDSVGSVFLDPEGLERLDRADTEITGRPESYAEIRFQSRKLVIRELFSGEMHRLSNRLLMLARHDRNARDLAPSEMLDALVVVTSSLPVYRTYIRDFHVSARDTRYLEEAFAFARAHRKEALDERVLQFLHRVLLLQSPSYAEQVRPHWLDFVMRWQQFTGRVMAKGVEDTAFYRYSRLVSLNEVGSEPDLRPADLAGRFHHDNAARAHLWPRSLNATSTHDSKRSEDSRARLHVLTELTDDWERLMKRWSRANARFKADRDAPDANEESMIYQTLLGVWPLDKAEEEGLPRRLDLFIEKALREAKEHSSWLAPDREYETAVQTFVRKVIDPANREFFASFAPFQQRIAWYGAINALSQVLLKITSPGIPDFYQGTELWDFSLVDPDNRREIDFLSRANIAKSLSGSRAPGPARLMRRWRDGRVKLFVMRTALELRRAKPETFTTGLYHPLEARGSHALNVCALARSTADSTRRQWAITVVPRLIAKLVKKGHLPCGGDVWEDTVLELPADAPRGWRNLFTGETLEAGGNSLALASILQTFPLALLEEQ